MKPMPLGASHSRTQRADRSLRSGYTSRREHLMTDLALRAVAGFRRGRGGTLVPPWIAPALLFCDAVVIELPLACLCFWIAGNLARAMETARPYLRAAGFTIEGHKLVPPAARPAEASEGVDRV